MIDIGLNLGIASLFLAKEPLTLALNGNEAVQRDFLMFLAAFKKVA